MDAMEPKVIEAHREEQAVRDETERWTEARTAERRLKRQTLLLQYFRKWLMEYLNIDDEPAELTYTHEGYKFAIFDLEACRAGAGAPPNEASNAGLEWHSYHLEGMCSKCGKRVWSPAIRDEVQLGNLLVSFQGGSHDCTIE